MTVYFNGHGLRDIKELQHLVAPNLDSSSLRFDPTDNFLFYDDLKTFRAALAAGGVVFTRAETKATTSKIDAERGRTSNWRSGTLLQDLSSFADGITLSIGSPVAMYQMDRPFLIADGMTSVKVAEFQIPKELADAGAPGDYVVIDLNNFDRVIRVAKEWVEKNIQRK